MQSERDGEGGVFRSRDVLDSFHGFGSRRSMFPSSFFGGRDPFDDPFFSRPIGSMFGSSIFSPSAVSSDTPESGRANELLVEEMSSDDEGGEGEVTGDERDNSGKQSDSSKEPTIEHPDDVVDERKTKDVTYRNDRNKVEGAQSQGRNFSFQTSRVTYGGVDGAYYTSTRTRRAGGDGVLLEEAKEADKTTGQASHRISRGLHDKGHSVTRKLKSDGKVDQLQTLHNLNEDELPGFEEAWTGNVKWNLPSWRNEFDMHGNAGSSSREQKGKAAWGAGLLQSPKQVQSSRGTGSANASRTTSDGRRKNVIRINIE